MLAGEEGQRDTDLSAPIILYDYPQIAPESPGDLFDGTEIDEILALRILTMTDAEKQEVRNGDDRARQILERTEMLPPEHFQKLHGALRGMRPNPEERNERVGMAFARGQAGTRISARSTASNFKSAIASACGRAKAATSWTSRWPGRSAIIESIEQDYEGKCKWPSYRRRSRQGSGLLRQPGHRFFFKPEEIEAGMNDAAADSDRVHREYLPGR